MKRNYSIPANIDFSRGFDILKYKKNLIGDWETIVIGHYDDYDTAEAVRTSPNFVKANGATTLRYWLIPEVKD